jgi:hypothetical protein
MTRTRIVSKSRPSWEVGGKLSHDPAVTSPPAITSAEVNPVHTTDEAAVAACFTKRSLCDWLAMSIRSWDRAAALGLTPQPDLVVGNSPR